MYRALWAIMSHLSKVLGPWFCVEGVVSVLFHDRSQNNRGRQGGEGNIVNMGEIRGYGELARPIKRDGPTKWETGVRDCVRAEGTCYECMKQRSHRYTTKHPNYLCS